MATFTEMQVLAQYFAIAAIVEDPETGECRYVYNEGAFTPIIWDDYCGYFRGPLAISGDWE